PERPTRLDRCVGPGRPPQPPALLLRRLHDGEARRVPRPTRLHRLTRAAMHRPTSRRTAGNRFRGERGVAVILTALVLVPLMVFAAFGVDLASFYARVGELQRAADAAALAGTVWMPDYDKAKAEAAASLRKNGFVDGE